MKYKVISQSESDLIKQLTLHIDNVLKGIIKKENTKELSDDDINKLAEIELILTGFKSMFSQTCYHLYCFNLAHIYNKHDMFRRNSKAPRDIANEKVVCTRVDIHNSTDFNQTWFHMNETTPTNEEIDKCISHIEMLISYSPASTRNNQVLEILLRRFYSKRNERSIERARELGGV